MFKRPLTWFVICLLCLGGARYLWKLGDRWTADKQSARDAQSPPKPKPSASAREVVIPVSTAPLVLLTQPQARTVAPKENKLAYRLSNTPKTAGQLLRNPHAVLLENALLDTARPIALAIPAHLRAAGDPGSYVVQSRQPVDDKFRARLRAAGAEIVAYIPNNAFLVRASAGAAQQLAGDAGTQAVLPFEPYYKLKGELLPAALKQDPMPVGLGLNLVLFADAAEATKAELKQLGVEIVSEERTPFGPLVRVRPAAANWFAVAVLPGVQTVESWRPRVLANDNSRVRIGVSTDTLVKTNYLNLTGTNVMVALVDSGVDAAHGDLRDRVSADRAAGLTDTVGHGTHVAGIIAGSGVMSTNPVNVGGVLESNDFGSLTGADFRGKAPLAKLFSLPFQVSDGYLQERAAQTNALISNNSWHYANESGYSISAASYDAAVRDALPTVTGSQPVLFVFAAGNEGGGGENGQGGVSDTINSPATAKNVLTVGAIEQLRNITNATVLYAGCADVLVTNIANDITNVTTETVCPTNYPWLGMTDSDTEVAAFSSRGNVGIGIEGDFGRFKPDLVAPGTFVVSTRSSKWDENEYYSPSNHHILTRIGQTVEGTNLHSYSALIPANAVALTIALVDRSADLPIYVWRGTDYTTTPPDFTGTNQVSFPGDSALSPVDAGWTWAIGNPGPNQTNSYTMISDLITTNDNGNYFEVLSNLNNTLGPDYRFESGTSMSAADASGTLALMQEFFTTSLKRSASPALLKALLINGARSVGGVAYDFQVQSVRNFQGWGLLRMQNSIPGSLTNFVAGQPASMWFSDQSPESALPTGASQTVNLSLPLGGARNQPLRVTLVWTDPPGNPAASIKLVNDLDLIVTNLNTGDVYFGNDIPGGSTYNDPWDPAVEPNIDSVNNVENIYLPPTLDTNYTITVRARAINVNAVTAHPNDTVQDYALVISSGDGQVVSALNVSPQAMIAPPTWRLTYVSNSFNQADASGFLLDGQRVGANTPLLGTTNGMTNQWHFYAVTNTTSFTNAAFITFLPTDLALPRMGVEENSLTNATRQSADIDLYVSADPGLLDLAPGVVAAAYSSRGRGGTEQVVLTNAVPGQIYYLGVKSEDQMAAEFSLFGVFSLTGFDNSDGVVNCFGLPQTIPDRTPDNVVGAKNAARVVCPCMMDGNVRRVVVTNVFTHEHFQDVLGVLNHEGAFGSDKFAVLNNHRDPPLTPVPPGPYGFIYEDNGENNVIVPVGYELLPSSGPESLRSFVGEPRIGPWFFTFVDDALTQTGRVESIGLVVELSDLGENAPLRLVPPFSWTYDVISVPFDATNLTVCVAGNTAPMELYLRKDLFPTQTEYDKFSPVNPPGGCLSLTPFDVPPLATPGRYYIGVYNPNAVAQNIRLVARIDRNPASVLSSISGSVTNVLIRDDAVSYATFIITNHLAITAMDVGLLIRHPRISDLALTLISPNGTRILLFEDRGMTTPDGMGIGSFGLQTTSMTPFYTNNFEGVPTGPYFPGAIFDGWNVLSNSVAVVRDGSDFSLPNNLLVLGEGVVSNTLPTTNSMSYQLSFSVSHAPYLVGTVAWWPFDGDAADSFGGHDGLLCCNVQFAPGEVGAALFGDGVATRLEVPRCEALDVGTKRGFSIEGWVNPPAAETGTGMSDGFENAPFVFPAFDAGGYVSGWLVETGSVEALFDGFGFIGSPDSGLRCLELNGLDAGSISTNFNTTVGADYVLSFAYSKNPYVPPNPGFVARANLDLTGQPTIPITYGLDNADTNLNWAHTSIVFTASSPVTTIRFTSLNLGSAGMYLDTVLVEPTRRIDPPAPLVEWNDPGSTNGRIQGVQLWLAGLPSLPSTNAPGVLFANIWDTNSQPHLFNTGTNALAYGVWQHVALTYDTNTGVAVLYTNGQPAVSTNLGSFVPRTFGDLYFGYHPAGPVAGRCFHGGLDEFGLYERALTDCEVAAIFHAGNRGKYGTNALTCPVAVELTLTNSITGFTAVFTNGLNWVNTGPRWELNATNFADIAPEVLTNGLPTNFTAIILRALDPNAAVDEFVLAAMLTNSIDGMMHFTENTNLAVTPVKFAPAPFLVSNFPPVLVFSNDFEVATQNVYAVGEVITGSSNSPAIGRRDWTVTRGPVTVTRSTFAGAAQTNCMALAGGAIETRLPTQPGHRYELRYTVGGPDAVGWWNGAVEPLSGRARDLISGNHGAFINGATNLPGGYVSRRGDPDALYLGGMIDFTNRLASGIELGDPPQLRMTNALSIEGWIKPQPQTDTNILALLAGSDELVIEQILFRGDSRNCRDPYWLAVEQTGPNQWHLLFHIEGPNSPTCGITVESAAFTLDDSWHHVAAVFEGNVAWTNNAPWPTNQIRVYVDGQLDTNLMLEPRESNSFSGFTAESPFADLEPSFSPGVSIGSRSRGDGSQPFRGSIDELTIYERALTGPEIVAIHAADRAGKSDPAAPPLQSLAKVRVLLDGAEMEVGHGHNGSWTPHIVAFTARQNNTLLGLDSLLPGTLVDEVTLTEVGAELNYLPEESLAGLTGEDAYGTWTLEMWDTRTGAISNNTELVEWLLTFQLPPANPPPVITLTHGIPYATTLLGHGVQYFTVPVPQWALLATNVLEYARSYIAGAPQVVGVLFSSSNYPPTMTNALFAPASFGTNTLTTNGTPPLVSGQTYYLAITNPSPLAVTFSFGVWFDITTLPTCQAVTNLVGPGGIPRYFQFDIPTNAVPPEMPLSVTFRLTGAQSNLTVVLSEHLPLPDLTHYDYLSQHPCTNDEFFMVVTNSTPFPIQTNRWYVGVFNSTATNVAFTVEACYTTNYPVLIPLTNGVPYVVAEATNQFVAPPGPPRFFFFQFEVTNAVDALLFELYNLIGAADLVLQRDVPPGQSPYFDGSFRLGTTPEQIVVRRSFELPDLRGRWYLGIFNNESTNLTYTIRAVSPTNDLLVSAQPIVVTNSVIGPNPRGVLLQWNAVEGESYEIEFTPVIFPATWTVIGRVQATTPCATFLAPIPSSGLGFYRIRQVVTLLKPPLLLHIQMVPGGLVRISWPLAYPGYTLQSATGVLGPWNPVLLPVTIEDVEYVVYDPRGAGPLFYRLIQ